MSRHESGAPAGSALDPYSYDGFRRAALDSSRSVYEKIGFPDEYRAGLESVILADIRTKLTNVDRPRQSVLDIGSGSSPLTTALIRHSVALDHKLTLIDSPEMLGNVTEVDGVRKQPGRFPSDHREYLEAHRRQLDAVLVYSVVQYVLAEASVLDFLDAAVDLLADGGQLLVGDIPNTSMRARFFASPAGLAKHRQFTGRVDATPPASPASEERRFDDDLLVGLIARYRAAGCHAYLVPQSSELPMATRREDLLVVRP